MTATTSTEICMRFALLDPISLALAFHHREIWVYLGKLRSVAQCKPFLGVGGGRGRCSLAYLVFKAIATLWLYEIVLKLQHSIQNLGSDHSLSHHC